MSRLLDLDYVFIWNPDVLSEDKMNELIKKIMDRHGIDIEELEKGDVEIEIIGTKKDVEDWFRELIEQSCISSDCKELFNSPYIKIDTDTFINDALITRDLYEETIDSKTIFYKIIW